MQIQKVGKEEEEWGVGGGPSKSVYGGESDSRYCEVGLEGIGDLVDSEEQSLDYTEARRSISAERSFLGES